jgi:hypothetical protein
MTTRSLPQRTIDLVREPRLWSLADELEQILQFRDAKDWVVASHALAAHRKEAALLGTT